MPAIEFQGIELEVTRSEIDGTLLIIIDTCELEEKDTFHGGVPRLRLMLNDCIETLNSEGEWIRQE